MNKRGKKVKAGRQDGIKVLINSVSDVKLEGDYENKQMRMLRMRTRRRGRRKEENAKEREHDT